MVLKIVEQAVPPAQGRPLACDMACSGLAGRRFGELKLAAATELTFDGVPGGLRPNNREGKSCGAGPWPASWPAAASQAARAAS